jgi:hypothetical protein
VRLEPDQKPTSVAKSPSVPPCIRSLPRVDKPRGGDVAMGASLSGCDQVSMRTSRMVAFLYFGAACCSRVLPEFARSASHECSSAVPTHHFPKTFCPPSFAFHPSPNRPHIGSLAYCYGSSQPMGFVLPSIFCRTMLHTTSHVSHSDCILVLEMIELEGKVGSQPRGLPATDQPS